MNKTELYRLIDAIPQSRLPEVKVYLEGISRSSSMDAYLDAAPYDDEELSPESRAAVKTALEEARRGEVFSREEIVKEFDLG
jgi:predicted transcriptional regulator